MHLERQTKTTSGGTDYRVPWGLPDWLSYDCMSNFLSFLNRRRYFPNTFLFNFWVHYLKLLGVVLCRRPYLVNSVFPGCKFCVITRKLWRSAQPRHNTTAFLSLFPTFLPTSLLALFLNCITPSSFLTFSCLASIHRRNNGARLRWQ